MKRRAYSMVAIMIGSIINPSYSFAYNDFDARSDCEDKVSGHGSEYRNPHDVNVNKTGHNSYVVNGSVDSRHSRDNWFTCRIEHKEVVSWNVSASHNKDDKSDKKLAVGAGILGLAAIAAIIASSKSNDQDNKTDEKQTQFNSGQSSPFEDMDFLQNECKRVLRIHLEEDHSPLEKIEIKSANLDSRILRGDGKIKFQNHERHKLGYECQFDRSGNIYDGSYQYND
jgi:hypothetical protein